MADYCDDEAPAHDADASAGSTEAGIVRGVSRSVAVSRAGVGRLPLSPRAVPRNVPVPRRVPVKQVARLTDRMSTGWDVWDAAASQDSAVQKRRQQLRSFATSLVKNTVLGTIVFETYCWVVAKGEELGASTSAASTATPIYKDVFETTPLAVHFVAGAAGGSLQGVGGTVWDVTAESLSKRRLSLASFAGLPKSMVQHSVAHSVLFGSYEACKRCILNNLHHWDADWSSNKPTFFAAPPKALLPHQRVEYFVGISLAGGVAGQFQHVMSHLLEQPTWKTVRPPSLASSLWAFPPSAIAFLAFEYGKDQVAELSGEEEEP